ncbi:hypothetical protein HDU97_005908 [Phlyctochytrium planicorne]|nr:hypothetical protein HDU97_005908 [Phlyctochytrium planicorne]
MSAVAPSRENSIHSRSGSSQTASKNKSVNAYTGIRVPFIVIIVGLVSLCSVAITATLLSLANVLTKSSNDMSIQQGIDSVFTMATEVQDRVSSLVALLVAGVTIPSIKVLRDDVNLFNVGLLNVTNYDTMWRQLYYQSFDPSISLVYFGSEDNGDMVASGKVAPYSLQNPIFIVNFMDQSQVLKQPSRCPLNCPQNMTAPGGWRIQYQVDSVGNKGNWRRNATFATKTRYWYVQGREMYLAGINSPQWTPVSVFQNNVDVGISAVVPLIDKESSALKGVLAVDITFGNLVASLSSFPLSSNGFVMVFNSDGTFFGSSVASEDICESFTNTTTNITTVNLKPIQRLKDIRLNLVANTVFQSANGNLTALPDKRTYTVNNLIFQHLVYRDGYGLNVIIVNGAPLTDYTGNIESTKSELIVKLDQNCKMMLYISVALIVFFTTISTTFITFSAVRPLSQLTTQVERLSKMDFENLQSYASSKNLSIITELRILQASYWNMTVKFAEELKNNRKLLGLGRPTQNTISSYLANEQNI